MAKRVLIVDDAVFMRDMIKDIFSSGEFEIVVDTERCQPCGVM